MLCRYTPCISVMLPNGRRSWRWQWVGNRNQLPSFWESVSCNYPVPNTLSVTHSSVQEPALRIKPEQISCQKWGALEIVGKVSGMEVTAAAALTLRCGSCRPHPWRWPPDPRVWSLAATNAHVFNLTLLTRQNQQQQWYILCLALVFQVLPGCISLVGPNSGSVII